MFRRSLELVVLCLASAPGALGAQGTPTVYRGALASGDAQLSTGEYYDTYEFQGRAGQRAVFDLTTSAFDPYIMVVAPSGEKKENDDFNSSKSHSRLELALEETGTYRVIVTSYEKGEAGAYELRIEGGGSGRVAAEPGVRVESGRLAPGDSTLRSGEYRDGYTFAGRRGQTVTVDLRSSDFDPYLIVIDPSGKQHENDDHEGDSHRSLVSYELPEDGAYRVWATTYKSGEGGAYELHIDYGAPATAAGTPAAPRGRDVGAIAYGESQAGTLSTDDARLTRGEYRDLYAFDGSTGDSVIIELASSEFDPYLALIPPDGEQIDNDDSDGRQDLSRVSVRLRASGRYRILATTYAAEKTGSYRLSLRRAGSGAVVAQAPPPTGAGRVYGVFVG